MISQRKRFSVTLHHRGMNTRSENGCYGKGQLFVASFAFYVITFEPIEIQTCSAPQNDRLNFSFVKNKHTVGKKMARYGRKMAIYQLLFLRVSQACARPPSTSEAIMSEPIKM